MLLGVPLTTISNVIQEKLRRIKPHLERKFEMEITAQAYDIADPEIRKVLLSEVKKHARNDLEYDVKHWREDGVMCLYRPDSFSNFSGYKILFNSESKALNDSRGELGSTVCHELLHEVFQERFIQGVIERLDFVTYPLLSEGFSEYGSLDVFTSLILEKSKV